MRMPVDHKIILTQVFRQIALLMGHVHMLPGKIKIQVVRNMLCPVLVIIAAHSIYMCDSFEVVHDLLPVYIPTVKDHFTSLQSIYYFRS